MAIALSEVANVSITSETAAVTQAGFGIPLILSASAGWTERVRSYATLTDVAADFASTLIEYQMAREILAQSPRPPVIYIGRRANKPTQRFAVTPTAANSTLYKMKIRSAATAWVEVSYTSDGSATVTEIIAALKIAIDALGLAVTVSDQTTYMRIVANTAGAWFGVESTTLPIENLKVAQDHADPGLSADLDAIQVENNDWYTVLSMFNSKDEVTGIATWVEAAKKSFVAVTQETNVISLALGGDTTTVAYALKNSARDRTALFYHAASDGFVDAGVCGKCLPTTPGEETWAHKQLTLTAGATSLTSTHVTNLKAKYCGYFASIGGLSLTFEGKASSGKFFDLTRLQDWVTARVQEGLVALVASARKVPYTDPGIHLVADVVKGVLAEGESNGGIAPGWVVTVPLVAAVSTADKTSRTLNNVKFDYTATGAVQKMNVSGTASV